MGIQRQKNTKRRTERLQGPYNNDDYDAKYLLILFHYHLPAPAC